MNSRSTPLPLRLYTDAFRWALEALEAGDHKGFTRLLLDPRLDKEQVKALKDYAKSTR